MIEEMLDQLVARGATLNEPASAAEVTRLATWFHRQSGRPLPTVYRELLARANGLEVDDVVLYGSIRSRNSLYLSPSL